MRIILPILLAGAVTACSPKEVAEDTQATTNEFELNMDDYSREFADHIGLSVGQDGYEAEDIIRLYASTVGTGEGARYDISSVQEGGDKILFGRAFDLADDSVRSQEVVAVISVTGTKRTLTDYGMRIQCWRATDPDEWTTELCP